MVLKQLKQKRGNVLILTAVFMTVFLFLFAFVIDIGSVYVAQSKLQQVADATSTAGANAGAYGFWSGTGVKRAIVKPAEANAAATKVLNENKKYMGNITITKWKTGATDYADTKYMYYGAKYDVGVWGKVDTIIAQSLLGKKVFELYRASQTTVTPQ